MELLVLNVLRHRAPKRRSSNTACLTMLVDRAGGVGSPDHCDADRPDLVRAWLLGRSACRTSELILFRDPMTGLTRFLGELHASSLMTLAVGHRRGKRCEEP